MSVPLRLGSYDVLRALGAGGMGEVFLAQEARSQRLVAIKRLRPDRMGQARYSKRFEREVTISMMLKHPAIVETYEEFHEGKNQCIVMEYIDGITLHQVLRVNALPLSCGLALARRLLQGLIAAHANGIIHRDLKSENILIRSDGIAKISDFGLAKMLEAESITSGRHVLGTVRSMSPEQAIGKPVDHRSDLFSLGTLLYEIFTGLSPFLADDDIATLYQVVHGEHLPAYKAQALLPRSLSGLIDQLLHKEPRMRPQSGNEVLSSLEHIATASQAVISEDELAAYLRDQITQIVDQGFADTIDDEMHTSQVTQRGGGSTTLDADSSIAGPSFDADEKLPRR